MPPKAKATAPTSFVPQPRFLIMIGLDRGAIAWRFAYDTADAATKAATEEQKRTMTEPGTPGGCWIVPALTTPRSKRDNWGRTLYCAPGE